MFIWLNCKLINRHRRNCKTLSMKNLSLVFLNLSCFFSIKTLNVYMSFQVIMEVRLRRSKNNFFNILKEETQNYWMSKKIRWWPNLLRKDSLSSHNLSVFCATKCLANLLNIEFTLKASLKIHPSEALCRTFTKITDRRRVHTRLKRKAVECNLNAIFEMLEFS